MAPAPLVTVSGLPGSGTSTVASRVAATLGIEHLDGGAVFRSLAAEHGMDLATFGALAESDPSIDVALDERLARRARAGGVVLESRLAGWIATMEGLAGIRVWIACDDDERALRVAARDRLDTAAALAANQVREASEQLRYRTLYGIDLSDLAVYDLVLDSTATAPDDLVDAVVRATH